MPKSAAQIILSVISEHAYPVVGPQQTALLIVLTCVSMRRLGWELAPELKVPQPETVAVTFSYWVPCPLTKGRQTGDIPLENVTGSQSLRTE